MKNLVRSYIRRRNPPLPKHIAELPNALQSGLRKEALKYKVGEAGPQEGINIMKTYNIEVVSIIDEDGFVHVLFYVPGFIILFKYSTMYFIDATFKIVPQLDGAYQFLSLMSEAYGQVIINML